MKLSILSSLLCFKLASALTVSIAPMPIEGSTTSAVKLVLLNNNSIQRNGMTGDYATGPVNSGVSLASSLFTIPMRIWDTAGTPRWVKMFIDTGSSDTWLRGAGCVAGGDNSCGQPGQDSVDALSYFTPNSKFHSAYPLGATINYGSGSTTVGVYSGEIGLNTNNQVQMNVGISTKQTKFPDGPVGLVGLGPGYTGSVLYKTYGVSNTNFINQLSQEAGISKVFSMFIANNASGLDHSSEINFGEINQYRYSGQIYYVPILGSRYYQFASNVWSANVGTLSVFLGGYGNSVVDSGTTMILFNEKTISNQINQNLGTTGWNATAGVYMMNCAKTTKGADLVFAQTSGLQITIPSYIWNFNAGDGNCFSGISYTGIPNVPHIWGTVFLSQAYTVYDRTSNPGQIGFARATHKP